MVFILCWRGCFFKGYWTFSTGLFMICTVFWWWLIQRMIMCIKWFISTQAFLSLHSRPQSEMSVYVGRWTIQWTCAVKPPRGGNNYLILIITHCISHRHALRWRLCVFMRCWPFSTHSFMIRSVYCTTVIPFSTASLFSSPVCALHRCRCVRGWRQVYLFMGVSVTSVPRMSQSQLGLPMPFTANV